VAEIRLPSASSDIGNSYPTGTTGQQMSNSYQPQSQQSSSCTALPGDVGESVEVFWPRHPRSDNSSDLYRIVPGSQGHENLTRCYRCYGYRDERFPLRCFCDKTVNHSFRNVGRYPAERSANFQPYFHGDTCSSSAAASEAASYSRRLPCSDSTRSQPQSQVIFTYM